jgi:hypothetical protein
VKSRWAAGLLVTCVLAACSGDDDGDSATTSVSQPSTTTAVAGITQEEATEIAMAAVREDEADFDFTATYTVVVDEGAAFHVAFPARDPDTLGGEPHVIVDKATGDVLESYRTL